MTRARTKTASKQSKTALSGGRGARKGADLGAIRQQITNIVGSQAVGMVKTTIHEVGKGHYLAMKYLFEMIGLYPGTGQEETPGEDSLAKTLLQGLGLPKEPKLETPVTKDHEAGPVAPAEDAVE